MRNWLARKWISIELLIAFLYGNFPAQISIASCSRNQRWQWWRMLCIRQHLNVVSSRVSFNELTAKIRWTNSEKKNTYPKVLVMEGQPTNKVLMIFDRCSEAKKKKKRFARSWFCPHETSWACDDSAYSSQFQIHKCYIIHTAPHTTEIRALNEKCLSTQTGIIMCS